MAVAADGREGSGVVLLSAKFIACWMCGVRKADFMVQQRIWESWICNLEKELMLWENLLK